LFRASIRPYDHQRPAPGIDRRLTGMTGLLDQLLSSPSWVVLLIVGLVVFAEDAVFVGFVIPGETAAILGGVAASLGHVPLWAVVTTVVIAAIVGDSVGYEVGRHLGPRVLEHRLLDKRREQIERAQDLLVRRGGAAVALGRSVALLRAMMPALAGMSRMPYGRFLTWNAAGGVVWGIATVAIGYFAGTSYKTVATNVGRGTALVVAMLAILAVVVWRVRRRRSE
jgi:membrane protein DedA with SNARE-associated domain